MYLVDTSAWVEYLRDTSSPACQEVDRLIRSDAVIATTEPIIMELLAGAPTPYALSELETLTGGLPLASVDNRLDYHDAAAIYRTVRASGRTVRKLIDCVIAAVASRTGATLVHRDADFEAIAACLPTLDARSLL